MFDVKVYGIPDPEQVTLQNLEEIILQTFDEFEEISFCEAQPAMCFFPSEILPYRKKVKGISIEINAPFDGLCVDARTLRSISTRLAIRIKDYFPQCHVKCSIRTLSEIDETFLSVIT